MNSTLAADKTLKVANISEQSELKITLIHHREWLDNPVIHPQPKRPGLALAGYLSYMNPKRIQVFGKTEMGYLGSLSAAERKEILEKYFSLRFPAVIVSTGLVVDEQFLRLSQEHHSPVLISALPTNLLLSRLTAFLYRIFSKRERIYGVMMDIMGRGVLITGESGIGKSETALELINKGYRLISDDRVEFFLDTNDRPVGRSTAEIQNLLEVRGLGIIDVNDIFGVSAMLEEKELDLVINLERWEPSKNYDRLGEQNLSTTILGVEIPRIDIPVAPGRNISTIIETAVRHFMAIHNGKKPYLEARGKTE